MGYIGVTPEAGFTTGLLDRFTSTTGTTVTLTHEISSENDIIVFVNFVKQDSTNYSVGGSGNKTLTLGGTLVSSDVVEVHYLNIVNQTSAPSAGSVGSSQITADVITGQTALASEPADTDEFLVSDAGTLKRIDYSLIKGSGKIGQVVTTTFTGTESTTVNLANDNSYTTSSVSATLTPTATSSKIYVGCTINAGSSDATSGCHIGRFLMAVSGGSTTAEFRGDAAGSNRKRNSTGRMNEGTGGTTMHTYGFNFVVTPSTTSAVTISYQFATRGTGSGTAYINRVHNDSDTTEHGRAASAITLMEVLA